MMKLSKCLHGFTISQKGRLTILVVVASLIIFGNNESTIQKSAAMFLVGVLAA